MEIINMGYFLMGLEFKHEIPNKYKLSTVNYYLAIIGSRSIGNRSVVYQIINNHVKGILKKTKINFDNIVLITGGAKGIDSIAVEWAELNNLSYIVIKPDWKKYGKSAGFKRNVNIIKPASSVLAIVEDSSSGSMNSISLAKKLHKPYTLINYNHYIKEKYYI